MIKLLKPVITESIASEFRNIREVLEYYVDDKFLIHSLNKRSYSSDLYFRFFKKNMKIKIIN